MNNKLAGEIFSLFGLNFQAFLFFLETTVIIFKCINLQLIGVQNFLHVTLRPT